MKSKTRALISALAQELTDLQDTLDELARMDEGGDDQHPYPYRYGYAQAQLKRTSVRLAALLDREAGT